MERNKPSTVNALASNAFANNPGHRFFDLLEVDISEKSFRTATTAGIIRYGPDLAHIRSECERLLREQTEKEDMQ